MQEVNAENGVPRFEAAFIHEARGDAERDLFDYIAVFCNRRRRHSTLGYCSPVQFLENWIIKQHDRQTQAE
jgi:hypothetical protein